MATKLYNITVPERPKVGEIIMGEELWDSARRGDLAFIKTGKHRVVRTKHVLESKYAPNGFYVVGDRVLLSRGQRKNSIVV